MHTHSYTWGAVTHSHPFGHPSHSHTQAECNFISYLAHAVSLTVTATYVAVVLFATALVRRTLTVVRLLRFHSTHFALRAPPVL